MFGAPCRVPRRWRVAALLMVCHAYMEGLALAVWRIPAARMAGHVGRSLNGGFECGSGTSASGEARKEGRRLDVSYFGGASDWANSSCAPKR